MNKNTTRTGKKLFQPRPIRFHRVEVGSEYTIFAEPSRNIRKSNDKRVYVKQAESYSTAKDDVEVAIILMPDDLVTPLTRGTSSNYKARSNA